MPKQKPIGLAFTGDAETFIPGWPNSDHNEPDDRLRAAKLGSGRYESVQTLPEPIETPAAPEPVVETPKLNRPTYFWLAENDRPQVTAEAADSAVAEAAAGAASPAVAATTEEANQP